jgi:carbamoyltransferase
MAAGGIPAGQGSGVTAILGISAFYHDAAAALVVDGRIVAAAQEERFSRKKHDDGFPVQAIEYCLEEAELPPEQLDYVGFYDKPYQKFDRLLETYLAYAPKGFRSFAKSIPLWMKRKLHLPREMNQGLHDAYKKRYVFAEHHESHAASAFFPSPFEEAAILTLDGVGEWATASYGTGRGNRVELSHIQKFPHSLGLLYSAFTYYGGFAVNRGEYKLMGLAPYGEPKYRDLILENLMDLKEDGSFRLDMSYFDYCQGLTMISKKFEELFGGPPRRPDAPIEPRDKDIAASIQRVTEEVMLRSARHVHAQTGLSKLCLAGGVALNCVGNGRILREGPFREIWIQPAAGDAGGALGVALLIWHQLLENERIPSPTDAQDGSLLGAAYDDDEIAAFLESEGVPYERFEGDEPLCDRVAGAIAAGDVVGWFQDRMEFGPRALGSRSILGDARDPEMQSRINQKVKFREGFRPFAPIVLREHAAEWFELAADRESPYMLLVAPVADHAVIPAVTHVDDSARVQTVDEARFPRLHRLLTAFHERTGCPVLVNTSFNLGWDPIVRTPKEAYETFMSCGLDVLCLGRFVLEKRAQAATVRATDDGASDEVLDGLLLSPCCGEELARRGDAFICSECRHEFPVTDDIPQLFWPHEGSDDGEDVTDAVQAFYEETPFPNYDEHDSVRSLIEKSRRGHYARRLDEAISFNTHILEVGCGTGQLANFLGRSCRRVIATDMCLNSLRLGDAFRREHALERVRFLQMNLFRPAVRAEQFDVVICSGVLHHTSAPYEGFSKLVPLLKPGGHFVLGLYNRYGRMFTDTRR